MTAAWLQKCGFQVRAFFRALRTRVAGGPPVLALGCLCLCKESNGADAGVPGRRQEGGFTMSGGSGWRSMRESLIRPSGRRPTPPRARCRAWLLIFRNSMNLLRAMDTGPQLPEQADAEATRRHVLEKKLEFRECAGERHGLMQQAKGRRVRGRCY